MARRHSFGIPLRGRTLRILFGKVFNGWDVLVILVLMASLIILMMTWTLLEFFKWISLGLFSSFIIATIFRFLQEKSRR